MAASLDGADAEDMGAVEALEIDLLLEGVFRRFGHDFRGYRREPLRARIRQAMRAAGLATVSALQDSVMHDAAAGEALLRALGARPVELFDRPDYFRALRATIVPWLRSCPSPRIWLAECGSAEEVCSLAILLEEERLYDRTQIFATGSNEALLREARQGGFAPDSFARYEENYRNSGGLGSLSDYCGGQGARGVFSTALYRNVTWAQYSLVTDASFNEFELIVCRSGLAEFGAPLQRRVLQLFHQSLPLFGVLAADRSEELRAAPFNLLYRQIDERQGLYRRVL
jgi:chemotaxis protein methyltransferase CheR